MIAWPVILEFLERQLPQKGKVFDLGCGTGGFTAKLASLGYQAIGVDPSARMIQEGKKVLDAKIEIYEGDASLISKWGRFDAVVAVMSFQFVSNVEELIGQIVRGMVSDGILVFAVFNPRFVTSCLKHDTLFCEFDSIEDPRVGTIELKQSVRIPTFIRSSATYRDLLEEKGFEFLFESYPPFTKEFREQYPDFGPMTEPEFMILGFQKASSFKTSLT